MTILREKFDYILSILNYILYIVLEATIDNVENDILLLDIWLTKIHWDNEIISLNLKLPISGFISADKMLGLCMSLVKFDPTKR